MNIVKYLHTIFLVLISASSLSMEKPAQTAQLTSEGDFIQAINGDREAIIDRMLRTKEINHLEITYKIKVNGKETEISPLNYAIAHGKLKAARTLLQYCPRNQVMLIDSQGESPLGWALSAGHVQIIPDLIMHGAKVDPSYIDYVNWHPKLSEAQKREMLQILNDATKKPREAKKKEHQD